MTYLIVGLLAIAAAGVVLYNRLINSRNRVDTAWSDIDVQLQRRHDLIPRLVTAVDQYAQYERATLEALTSLRSASDRADSVSAKGDAEAQIEEGVHRLIALAESYPDLKANTNFLRLQEDLVDTENVLQFARRYYNASVRDFNTMIGSVPSNIVARAFGFTERDFFQRASDEVAAVPLVSMESGQ